MVFFIDSARFFHLGFGRYEDWEAIKSHAEFAKANFEKLLGSINVADCENEVNACHNNHQELMTKTANIMLDDNKKWHLILKEKSNYHWI